MFKVGVIKTLKGADRGGRSPWQYDVRFSIDHQAFCLNLGGVNRKTAQWFAKQLRKALKRLQKGAK